ncbi:MAG: hypothetical protein ACPGVO_00645 [Spirulinaceae cyanobacterium]
MDDLSLETSLVPRAGVQERDRPSYCDRAIKLMFTTDGNNFADYN